MALRPFSDTYDYIVVGGGLAGCVLASRLHEKIPSASVLIVEAGPDCQGHPLTSAPLACFGAHHSDLDWDYKTVPQKHLDGRECYASAGKVLSGGNAINYGTWTRGPKSDYDHWADVVGDQSWSYNGLLPYFKKAEHHYGDPQKDGEEHGFDGSIYNTSVSASDPERKYPLRDPILAAWKSIGVEEVKDGNSGSPLGLSELVENWRDGQRQPVSQVYNLQGVDVMTSTLVASIDISDRDGTKHASGIKLHDGRSLLAKREIILSAGAYRSPQLLLLSGIGPTASLSQHGIPTIHDLPTVGTNFHDHFSLCLWWKLRSPDSGLALGSAQWTTQPALFTGLPSDWLSLTHLPTSVLAPALSTDRAPPSTSTHLLNPSTPHIETFAVYAPAGAAHTGTLIPLDGSHIATCTLGMAPTSRGRITLASADPAAPPAVDPNYYATSADRAMLRAGVRQALALMASSALAGLVAGETPPAVRVGDPEPVVVLTVDSTDAEIDARVRRAGNTFYHAAGSCSMGSVVDARLRVFGVGGLRVCDASVLPVSVAAHLQVPVLAVAERAADMVAEDYLFTYVPG